MLHTFFSWQGVVLIFLFSCAVLIGPAYTTCDNFDFSHSPDTKSYMKMAQGDFNVNIVHRYRVIVPGLAAAVFAPIAQLYKTLWPDRHDYTEKGLMLSFLLVNLLLVSLTGAFIYFTCVHYHASPVASLIGLFSFLTSTWTLYAAALPLTDSLYLLVLALAIFGIKAKNKPALIVAILIGPFAKESFIFIAPVILLFGRDTLNLKIQIPLFLVAGGLAFLTRYCIDQSLGTPPGKSITDAMSHFETVTYSLKRMSSLRGIGEIMRAFGLFTLVIFLGLAGSGKDRKAWISSFGAMELFFLFAILIHVLLSGDISRMLYLSCPLAAVAIALIVDRHSYLSGFRQLFR